jgi:putative ABC transport system ATP-binding protein
VALTLTSDRTTASVAAGRTPEAQTDQIIQVENVSRTYTTGNIKVEALRGVSLSVTRGETVAIMGPSGCGKTTLLNSMSGLDRVDGGTVRIESVDLASLSDKERTAYRAANMGFVFQTYNLLPVLTAAENVELPLIVSGVGSGEARRRAIDALDRMSIADKAKSMPAQLSGGQRQRVTIARALVNNPAIVWADEPTGALDSRTAHDIMSLIEDLNREHHQTFVIVTHDVGVGKRCQRLIHMSDGVIVDEERN